MSFDASDSTVVYVDAAEHQYRPHTYVAVVVRATDGKLLNDCSVRAMSAKQAEEATITLALYGTPKVTTIYSDSRTAIANLGRGSIGTPCSKPAAEKQARPITRRSSTPSRGLTRPWLGKNERSKLLKARAGPAVVEV
ncbi:hypothetical protein MRX96_023744 [Rhipicephalus microplus]